MSTSVRSTLPLTSFIVGTQRQAVILRRLPDYLSFVAMSPLSTIAFLAIVRSVGRDDLGVAALISVSIIITWQTGLFIAGDTIARDRQMGLLENQLAAPVAFQSMVLGRIVVSATFSFVPFPLSYLVARLVFGADVVAIEQPTAMLAVLFMSWFATLGALLMMSPISVLSGRSTALFNGLSYPLFLLAGIFVPVDFLPSWIRPVSGLLFMRWSAEGMRNAASGTGEIRGSIIGLSLTGIVMLIVGAALLRVVVRRMRSSGRIIDA